MKRSASRPIVSIEPGAEGPLLEAVMVELASVTSPESRMVIGLRTQQPLLRAEPYFWLSIFASTQTDHTSE